MMNDGSDDSDITNNWSNSPSDNLLDLQYELDSDANEWVDSLWDTEGESEALNSYDELEFDQILGSDSFSDTEGESTAWKSHYDSDGPESDTPTRGNDDVLLSARQDNNANSYNRISNAPDQATQHLTPDKFRQLRDAEYIELKAALEKFNTENKIDRPDVELKKKLVNFILKKLKDRKGHFGGHIFKTHNCGSAYEKLQAGEASDFDVLVFLNVKKWRWEVRDAPEKPGFVTIRHTRKEKDNPKSFDYLVDRDDYLSGMKVRKLFTKNIDKFINKDWKELRFPEEPNGKEVKITRKHCGPAITLTIMYDQLEPFTLDLVTSIASAHVTLKDKRNGTYKCDFVAKPWDRRNVNSEQNQQFWRKSYSIEENKLLAQIDRSNQKHRQILRTFKLIKEHQSQLQLLESYVLKNVLLGMTHRKLSWSNDQIAHRFVDMVIELRDCLHRNEVKVHCDPSINLLTVGRYAVGENDPARYKRKREQLQHIRFYLRRITNKGLPGYLSLLKSKEVVPSTETQGTSASSKKLKSQRAKRKFYKKAQDRRKPAIKIQKNRVRP